MLNEILRKNLTKAMKNADYQPTRLALDMGYGINFINDFLKGTKKSLKIDDIEKIEKALKKEHFGLPPGKKLN